MQVGPTHGFMWRKHKQDRLQSPICVVCLRCVWAHTPQNEQGWKLDLVRWRAAGIDGSIAQAGSRLLPTLTVLLPPQMVEQQNYGCIIVEMFWRFFNHVPAKNTKKEVHRAVPCEGRTHDTTWNTSTTTTTQLHNGPKSSVAANPG